MLTQGQLIGDVFIRQLVVTRRYADGFRQTFSCFLSSIAGLAKTFTQRNLHRLPNEVKAHPRASDCGSRYSHSSDLCF